MPSVVSHFAVGATLALPFALSKPVRAVAGPAGLVIWAGLLAASPDLDTIYFGLIPYAHFLGHRGFFHSPFFAALFSVLPVALLLSMAKNFGWRAALYFFAAFAIAMISHGLLDAMSDGGMGVMLRYPLSEARQFLPWRPFHTPPIYLHKLSLKRLKLMFTSEWPLMLCCVFGVGVFVMLLKRRPVAS